MPEPEDGDEQNAEGEGKLMRAEAADDQPTSKRQRTEKVDIADKVNPALPV
jgi:hypothetical protein